MLYQKHRPIEFEQFVGNKKEVELIKNSFSNHLPHCFLFTGFPGTGKTTMALLLAHKLTEETSIYEYNSSNTNGVDTSREIIELISSPPLLGKNIVIILDEFQKASSEAQNALLKSLENTPDYVYFFICSSEPTKIITAIHSRSTIINFKPVSIEEVYKELRRIKIAEKLEVDSDILDKIAEKSEGVLRNAIVLLESVSNIVDDTDKIEYIENITEYGENSEVIELCRMIAQNVPWNTISKALINLQKAKEEPERIRRAILGYLSKCILGKVDDFTAEKLKIFLKELFNSGFPGLISECYEASNLSRGKKEEGVIY